MLALLKGVWIRKGGLVTDVTAKCYYQDVIHRFCFFQTKIAV